MRKYMNIFMDETFKSVINQFAQRQTFLVDFGSTEEETNKAQLFQALLPDKNNYI